MNWIVRLFVLVDNKYFGHKSLLAGKVSLDNDLKAFYANSTDSNPMILFNC
jgi:hypothetical protein